MVCRWTIARTIACATLTGATFLPTLCQADDPKPETPAVKAAVIKAAADEANEAAAKAAEAAAQAAKEATKAAEGVDIYKVPPVDDVETLVLFIKNINGFRPTTLENYQNHMKKAPTALKEAAEKILKLEKDTESPAHKLATQVLENAEIQTLGSSETPNRAEIFAKYKEKIVNGEKNQASMRQAMQIAQLLERAGDTKLAAQAFNEFGEMFAKSDDKQVAKYGEKMIGSARRMNLLGNEMKVEGKTFAGEAFDLASLKGKVVLVDFWATWCGPCLAEHPNVEKNYKAYHDKGFEVVGISLDEKREALDKFMSEHEIPWITLHQNDGSGWDHPVATHYGIMGIPTVILINKEGKVISLRARGPELGKLLEQELGPVTETATEAEESKVE